MAEPDRTNADAERVSDIVAKLRVLAGLQEYLEDEATADEAADIIEAQSKALAEARVAHSSFDAWWSKDGQYIDPDTSDVPWFDKRRGLAEAAFLAGVERGTGVWPNFVAPPKYDHPALGWTDPSLPDFQLIWKTAGKAGYAVGLHGSMKRDCDLIAAPWTAEAVTAEELITRLCVALNAREIGPREPKPLGRIAVNLQIDGYFRLIDLSIVPALTPMADETNEPRNSRGQPVSCARVWVPVEGEQNGGHYTPECPNLKETNPNDMAGERYRCEVCGYSYYLDYEDMK